MRLPSSRGTYAFVSPVQQIHTKDVRKCCCWIKKTCPANSPANVMHLTMHLCHVEAQPQEQARYLHWWHCTHMPTFPFWKRITGWVRWEGNPAGQTGTPGTGCSALGPGSLWRSPAEPLSKPAGITSEALRLLAGVRCDSKFHLANLPFIFNQWYVLKSHRSCQDIPLT